MSSESPLPVDLRTWLVNLMPEVGTRVHYLMVPESYSGPYLWYGWAGSGDDEDLFLGQLPGYDPFREEFDVEIISDDVRDIVNLARRLKLHSTFRGDFGDGRIQGLFVRDHSDQYIPRGIGGDEGLSFSSVRLEIVGYEKGA